MAINGGSDVFESRDAGEEWKRIDINNVLHGRSLLPLLGRAAFDPVSSEIWAVGYQAIYRYDNATLGWNFFDLCPVNGRIRTADVGFDHSGHAFVLTLGTTGCPDYPSYSLLWSGDRGATWTARGALPAGVFPNQAGSQGSLSAFRNDPNFLYATRLEYLQGSGSVSRTFRSIDGATTWQDVSGSTTSVGPIRVSQSNRFDVLKASASGVERSLDGGLSWTAAAVPIWGNPQLERSDSEPRQAWLGGAGGLFKTTDGGVSWAPQTVRAGSFTVFSSDDYPTALAVDPGDADTVFLGTTQGAIVRSTDGGATWALRNSGLIRQKVMSVTFNRARPEELLAVAESGPFVSRTAGGRWTASKTGWTGVVDYSAGAAGAIATSAPDVFYAATRLSLFRSANRGLSWSRVLYLPDLVANASQLAFDVDPFDANHLVVSALSYVGQQATRGGIWASSNGGLSWTPLTAAVGPDTQPHIHFAQDAPQRVYANDMGGVFRSENGGLTWLPYGTWPSSWCDPGLVAPAPSQSTYVYAATHCYYPTGGARIHYFDPSMGAWQQTSTGISSFVYALAVDPHDPLTAYVGFVHPGTVDTKGGIARTTDGGRSWSRVAGVLDAYSITSIALSPVASGTVLVSTDEGGVFRSTDNGQSWTELTDYGTVADLTTVTVKDPSNPNLLFVGTEGYGVQASTDGGKTFVPRATGLGNYNVNALAFDPVTPTTMYAGTDAGIYKSTNSGSTWTPTAQGTGRITDIVVDTDGGSGRLIWGTVEGLGVARSLDQGATFQVFSTGLASLELTSLEVDHTGTGRLIWGTTKGGDGVVYSDDNGVTWKSAAGNGLTNRDVNDVKVQSGSGRLIWGTGRLIWATTDNGVFYSRDGGQSWTDLSLGLPSGIPVTSASIDPNTDEVLVSLYGEQTGGVYRGGNVTGVWSAFNAGLEELKVKRLTNDGGRVLDAVTKATTFYASTAGQGVFAAELRTGAGASPRITTAVMSVGTLRRPYSQTLTAAEGTPPYRWSLLEGSLPGGLTLDSTGLVSGSPSALGSYSFKVQVADQASRVDNGELVLSVVEGTVVGGLPQLSIGDVSRPEGQSGTTTFSFPVTLSAPSGVPVAVSFLTASGTAMSGSDFTAASGTLSFAANETTKAIGIAVKGDRGREVDEVFYVNLSAAVGATVGDAQGVGTIRDDDADDPTPLVTIDDRTVSEGSAVNASFRVLLSNPSAATVTVRYATADGSAQGPGDYTPVSGTLTFTPGRTQHSILVPITTDAVAEGSESFSVNLTNPTNATIGDGQGVGTILRPAGGGERLHVALLQPDRGLPLLHDERGGEGLRGGARLSRRERAEPAVQGAEHGGDGSERDLPDVQPEQRASLLHGEAGERDFLKGVGWVYEKDEGFMFPARRRRARSRSSGCTTRTRAYTSTRARRGEGRHPGDVPGDLVPALQPGLRLQPVARRVPVPARASRA